MAWVADDEWRWRELRAQVVASASVVDHLLEHGKRPPLDMAGGVLDAASIFTERWEGPGRADRPVQRRWAV